MFGRFGCAADFWRGGLKCGREYGIMYAMSICITRPREAWAKFIATRILAIGVDTALIGFAYLISFVLRFDFQEPRWGWRAVALSFVTVAAVHIVSLLVCGCYRLAWRRICAADLPRYIGAMFLACVVLTALRFYLPGEFHFRIRPPYSITLMCFVFSTVALIGVRYLWRAYTSSRRKPAAALAALLERKENTFDNTVAARYLSGKVVMVTGAGGSIGSEIVRQVAGAGARQILLVERCENALYEIDRQMRGVEGRAEVVPIMMDVANRERLGKVLEEYRPQVVLHAAASKHVPMVELNPDEGWANNVEGTRAVAECAKAAGVERFVLISTDKAVNPISVMGKSKREAEKIVMALNEGAGTSFCAVRFGNVFGSSGSVVPLFEEQIARRQAVTVTHPDMRRYFMTIQEAVSLVLQAASRTERAIYTLDMGESVRILDLAEGMIRRVGFRPYVDIPIVFIGKRPGEKLFEELDISEKSAFKTDMAKIYVTRV